MTHPGSKQKWLGLHRRGFQKLSLHLRDLPSIVYCNRLQGAKVRLAVLPNGKDWQRCVGSNVQATQPTKEKCVQGADGVYGTPTSVGFEIECPSPNYMRGYSLGVLWDGQQPLFHSDVDDRQVICKHGRDLKWAAWIAKVAAA